MDAPRISADDAPWKRALAYSGVGRRGVYLYFPGVFSITRFVLKRQGVKVGRPASEVTAYVFGTLWTLSALYMIALAVAELAVVGGD